RYFVVLVGPLPSLANEFLIGESLASDLRHHQTETICVILWVVFGSAILETEFLLVQVAEQMKRLNRNIRAMNATLKQPPEILRALRVNLSLHVLYRVINNSLVVIVLKAGVSGEFIRVEFGNPCERSVLQSPATSHDGDSLLLPFSSETGRSH